VLETNQIFIEHLGDTHIDNRKAFFPAYSVFMYLCSLLCFYMLFMV
jgi:hypothetical protein